MESIEHRCDQKCSVEMLNWADSAGLSVHVMFNFAGSSFDSNRSQPVAQAIAPPPVAPSAELAAPAVVAHAPPSSWNAPGVVLGVLSAAKGALKLAPVLAEGGIALAQSGADNALYYTRRGVELGAGALRTGVTYTGDAAARAMEARSAAATDEETQTKWKEYAARTKRGASLVDRGLDYGADLVEDHVIGVVGKVVQGGLNIGGHGLKHSMRSTKLLIGAADVFAKASLKASGYDVKEIEEAQGHEKMIDCILNIIQELRTLNASLEAVGTAELIKTLMTYARLVETVEAQSLFRDRRPVLSEYLESIGEERRKNCLRSEQEAKVQIEPSKSGKGLRSQPDTPGGAVVVSATAEKSGPQPPSKRSRLASWFSWGWGSQESKEPVGPAPQFESDPAPDAPGRNAYEDGLYALAGGGMRRVSRLMLFSGCAYGPRFMRFLGVPTRAQTHQDFVVEQCGVKKEDMVLSDFNSTLARPGYFLALDHQTKQIVLVIRGSSAFHDALTDLTCSSTRHVSGSFGSKGHAEGSCHEGMLKSAQWFSKHMREPILDLLKTHPDYSLVLTGHSLGGGVGALLLLLWLHDTDMNPSNRRIQGYFFGSPCVVSAELAHLGSVSEHHSQFGTGTVYC
jgi:hypothetical protein